jgi:hypothetical protein
MSLEKMEKLGREGRLYFPKKPDRRIQLKRYMDEQSGAAMSGRTFRPSIRKHSSALVIRHRSPSSVHGTPTDLDGARDLAMRDKYQFQWWAVSLVNAVPFAGKKKGADVAALYLNDSLLSAECVKIFCQSGRSPAWRRIYRLCGGAGSEYHTSTVMTSISQMAIHSRGVILSGRVSINNPSPARFHKFRRRPSMLPSRALASSRWRHSDRTHGLPPEAPLPRN